MPLNWGYDIFARRNQIEREGTMATNEEAINRVIEAGFSHRCAVAIVNDLGANAVFQGMRERENTGSAEKFVQAHGYDKPSAAAIVEKAGAHIINTAAALSTHDPKELQHSLWDFPTEGKRKDAAA
jgi:hypothetical protein